MKNTYNPPGKYLESMTDSLRLKTNTDVNSGRGSMNSLTSKARSNLTCGWKLAKQLCSRTIFRVDKQLHVSIARLHDCMVPIANPILHTIQDFFEADEVSSTTSGENNDDQRQLNDLWQVEPFRKLPSFTKIRVGVHIKTENLFQQISSFAFRLKIRVRIAFYRLSGFLTGKKRIMQEPQLIPLFIENLKEKLTNQPSNLIRKRLIKIFSYICRKFYCRICFLLPSYCKTQRFSASNLSIRDHLPSLSSGFP